MPHKPKRRARARVAVHHTALDESDIEPRTDHLGDSNQEGCAVSAEEPGQQLAPSPQSAFDGPLYPGAGPVSAVRTKRLSSRAKQLIQMATHSKRPLTVDQLKLLKSRVEAWMPQVQVHWVLDGEITGFAIREICRRIRSLPSLAGVRTDSVGVKHLILSIQKTLKRKRAERAVTARKATQARMLRH